MEITRLLRSKQKPHKGKKAPKADLEQDIVDDAWDDVQDDDLAIIDGPKPQKRILAVIGSSRGICGQYNKQLAHQTARLLEKRLLGKVKLKSWLLGYACKTRCEWKRWTLHLDQLCSRVLCPITVRFETDALVGGGPERW